MGIFIRNMRMQKLYDSRGGTRNWRSILSFPGFGVIHNSALILLLLPSGIMRNICDIWILKGELAIRWAATATQVSRNFYQTIRAARRCPWELCADTSHSFPESQLSMSTEKAFGSSYWSIKSYKKYDSYYCELISMLIYLARIA